MNTAAALAVFVLCGLAHLAQGRAADGSLSLDTTNSAPKSKPNGALTGATATLPSLESAAKLEQPKSANIGPSYLDMQEQYDIITLCTQMPFKYNQLLQNYLKVSASESSLPAVQTEIETLKRESGSLKANVNAYAKSVRETDPNADSVRRQMVSGANSLSRSLEKLYQNLADNPQMGTGEKIAFVQNDIKPAIMEFEEGCLSQTQDILKNVIDDLQGQV